MPSSFMKFSRLSLKGNVWRSVWRICMWILGLKTRVNNFVRGWLAWRLARIGQVSFRNYLPSKTIYLSLKTERAFFFEPCKFNSRVFRVNLSFLRENASIQLNDETTLTFKSQVKAAYLPVTFPDNFSGRVASRSAGGVFKLRPCYA